MVKTTINIPDEKWKRFNIKVIEVYGVRKVNLAIEDLIDKFIKTKIS